MCHDEVTSDRKYIDTEQNDFIKLFNSRLVPAAHTKKRLMMINPDMPRLILLITHPSVCVLLIGYKTFCFLWSLK